MGDTLRSVVKLVLQRGEGFPAVLHLIPSQGNWRRVVQPEIQFLGRKYNRGWSCCCIGGHGRETRFPDASCSVEQWICLYSHFKIPAMEFFFFSIFSLGDFPCANNQSLLIRLSFFLCITTITSQLKITIIIIFKVVLILNTMGIN